MASGLIGKGGSISNATFSDLGGAVSDLFAGFGANASAKGARDEAKAYGLASTLATQNSEYTKVSTDIQEMQQKREAMLAQGATQSELAGAGFSNSGSALDILRSNASQAALQNGVTAWQGAITEAGYQEQASAYTLMQKASLAQAEADDSAGFGDFIGSVIKGGAAIASVL